MILSIMIDNCGGIIILILTTLSSLLIMTGLTNLLDLFINLKLDLDLLPLITIIILTILSSLTIMAGLTNMLDMIINLTLS